jgi:indole-3-glycerol phosphate synthase
MSVFQGARIPAAAARAACRTQGFVVDLYQVYESRAEPCDLRSRGAPMELAAFEAAARTRHGGAGEVHNEAELDRALALTTPLIGINNRNLRTFETSLATTIELLPRMPSGRIVITESGILAPSDVARMRAAGVHAFLVGEAFMRAPDPGAELERLFE